MDIEWDGDVGITCERNVCNLKQSWWVMMENGKPAEAVSISIVMNPFSKSNPVHQASHEIHVIPARSEREMKSYAEAIFKAGEFFGTNCVKGLGE